MAVWGVPLTHEDDVTLGAEGQGMVAGDLVNTASRLQGHAQAGAVLVSESTRLATDNAVVYESTGATELRGKAVLRPSGGGPATHARGHGRRRQLSPWGMLPTMTMAITRRP